MTLEFSHQIFKKYSNIKFHEYPSSRSQVVPCRQTEVTKLLLFTILQTCLSANKETLYQIFLSITYIHAYDYILAANPRCPKV